MYLKIKVLGGGREVGRSAIIVESVGKKLLLDYGVSFDEKDRPILPLHVRPIEVLAVLISHAHLDHIGAAPYLYITGNPKLLTTRPTIDVARLLTIDFLRLNSLYVDYEMREFDRMNSNAQFVEYGEEVQVDDFSVQFFNAGHIIGSSLIYIETPGDENILYTGDFNTNQTWTLKPADTAPLKVTTLIVESTYGSRNHPPRGKMEERLIQVVEETIDRGGVALIPAFSVGRTQEVITLLYTHAPYLDIYVDGLSRDVTEIYSKHRGFLRDPVLFNKVVENINFVTDSSMRRKIVRKPCVIVASAGMLKGGPSLYYLKKLYDNSKNSIILVSYQAVNSNGHRILEEGQLPQHDVGPIKARIEWIDLSSHAGKDDIVKYTLQYKNTLRNIIIVHGDYEEALVLSTRMKEFIGEDINIYIPASGEEVEITT
jgi:putative mRNA 3-end processing factor